MSQLELNMQVCLRKK